MGKKPSKFGFLKLIDQFGRPVNLRFNGADKFKTYCGACATIIMFMALFIIFILNVNDIILGKIDSFNYMIRNTHHESANRKTKDKTPKEQILAFSMDKEMWDPEILKISAIQYKSGDKTEADSSLYDCSEFAYEKMSDQVKEFVPPGLKIMCLKITTKELKSGIIPQINFAECTKKVGCKDLKIRNKMLEDFNIYGFTLADASDFTSANK